MVPTDLAGAMWADAQAPSAEDFDAVVDGLIADFVDQLPAWVIIEHVVLACQQLLAAGVQAGLGPATEAVARMRLRGVSSGQGANEPASRRALHGHP